MKQKSVLVFVTSQRHCEQLINAGKMLSSQNVEQLFVVSIRPANEVKNLEGTVLEHLYQVCVSVGASMYVFYNNNPVKAAIKFIRKNNISHIITGLPEKIGDGSFTYEIQKAFPLIPLSVVTPAGVWYSMVTMESSGPSSVPSLKPLATKK